MTTTTEAFVLDEEFGPEERYRVDPDWLLAQTKYDPETGCRLWTGGKVGGGYGLVSLGRRGLAETTHRLSYEIFVGPIPEGAHVLHRCDQPACIAPEHLFLGDQQTNPGGQRCRRHG